MKYCHNCGVELPESVKFCNKCGTAQILDAPETPETVTPSVTPAQSPQAPANLAPKTHPKAPTIIIALIAAFVIVGGGIFVITAAASCDYGFVSCMNSPVSGGSYCYAHTCGYSNCTRFSNGSYCYSHECGESGCNSEIKGDGSYCREHSCKADGCYRRKSDPADYCNDHLSIAPERPSIVGTWTLYEVNPVGLADDTLVFYADGTGYSMGYGLKVDFVWEIINNDTLVVNEFVYTNLIVTQTELYYLGSWLGTEYVYRRE
ncbi:MAG: zinc ribbon domain-containing protein [Oscillospiraceae bacterium]|nr:zinc ribbon domain-containing protein [Oscillospiraceae bacterium]